VLGLKKRIEEIMTRGIALELNFARKMLLEAAGFVALAAPIVVGMLNAPPVQAQLNATTLPPTFEVASIKPSDPAARGTRVQLDRGRFTGSNLTVKFLMQYSYEVRDFQIQGGPGWIGTEGYDISAKGGGDAKGDDLKPMVQALLADRFKLALHRSTKELPIYALVVAKGGPKMKISARAGDERGSGMRIGRGQLEVQQVKMAELATQLARTLGRSVIDRTELTGEYDFKLEWTPDEAQPGIAKEPGTIQMEGAGPSIFTALQEQLGLKLESTKGPVEILVVDRAERPSAN
jgi:bla regulator protein BlaR1